MGAKQKPPADAPADPVSIIFTGAAGGTSYSYDGGHSTLVRGSTVTLPAGEPMPGHFRQLLASGDAEMVKAE